MYVAIRRLTAKTGVFDEVIQRDEGGLVPLLRSMPGFVEFDLVQVGEDVGVSILLFETQEQAEEANRQTAQWVRENIVPLVSGPAEIVAVGEMRLRSRSS
jgi:heme-degrading monooxygenase HmoA